MKYRQPAPPSCVGSGFKCNKINSLTSAEDRWTDRVSAQNWSVRAPVASFVDANEEVCPDQNPSENARRYSGF